MPTDPAVPELKVSAPALADVVPEEAGVEEDEVDEPEADEPELQAAAVTAIAAMSAMPAKRLVPERPRLPSTKPVVRLAALIDPRCNPGTDLPVELSMSFSELGMTCNSI